MPDSSYCSSNRNSTYLPGDCWTREVRLTISHRCLPSISCFPKFNSWSITIGHARVAILIRMSLYVIEREWLSLAKEIIAINQKYLYEVDLFSKIVSSFFISIGLFPSVLSFLTGTSASIYGAAVGMSTYTCSISSSAPFAFAFATSLGFNKPTMENHISMVYCVKRVESGVRWYCSIIFWTSPIVRKLRLWQCLSCFLVIIRSPTNSFNEVEEEYKWDCSLSSWLSSLG